MVPTDVAAELELIRAMIGKYFPIYDVKVSAQSVQIFISPDPTTMEASFDSLRKEMNEKKFIPFISHAGGEYTITVVRKGERNRMGVWTNVILLGITFVTTILAGAFLWAAYINTSNFLTLEVFAMGALFFAIPLMTILGVHELAHYLTAKRHGVAASLPFFIPSIPPLGTFGAFISIRDPIPSRKALVDIGISGPIAGLVVAIPVFLFGMVLTQQSPHYITGGTGGLAGTMASMLSYALSQFFPISGNVIMHPLAFAGWVGLFVTAINLLPAGQLDGGHVARGLLGDNSRFLSYITVAALFLLGMLVYSGWLLFAVLIFFLGLRHPAPLNDISKLGGKRTVLGAIGIALLVVTFVPVPIYMEPNNYSFSMHIDGLDNATIAPGHAVDYRIWVNNTGNTNETITVNLQAWEGLAAYVYADHAISGNGTSQLTYALPYQGSSTVLVKATALSSAQPITRTLPVYAASDPSFQRQFNLTVTIS
ncbi:MAG: site-2 protease family protein [Methanomassiliicoccales archaeon]|jgi:membrane-associated protease RseP (regulator of RpoE activity)